MALEIGSRGGPYAVSAEIGEGGMGKVCEASCRGRILPVFNQSPCVGCEVSCCKEYVVQLNGHDMYRLIASVELPWQQYVELRRSTDRSAVLLEDASEVDFYELTLAHGPHGCVFLEQNGKQLECGVHPSKPGVCLGYPFSLSRGKIVQIAEKLCPVDWKIDADSEGYVGSVINELQEEWFLYDELVSEWNAGRRPDRSLSAFVGFALAWVTNSRASCPPPDHRDP